VVLTKIGRLPEPRQDQLCKCLVRAFSHYQLASKTVERTTPSAQQKQLRQIEVTAKHLLRQLESSFVKLWLTTAGIQRPTKKEYAVNMKLEIASDRFDATVMVLKDLCECVATAIQEANKRVLPGRGGDRARPTPKGRLISDAIAIYSHIRDQYPQSGSRPGYGGPMVQFIQAVGRLYGVSVRDSAIREVWRTRKSKQKEN
jgi:hypothetical protein